MNGKVVKWCNGKMEEWCNVICSERHCDDEERGRSTRATKCSESIGFSLKGFIFITAGEHSVTCGEKVMTPRNSIGNSQGQVLQFWMASCLAMTTLGFARVFHLLGFSLKGFIFITAGERSVTCGEKAMKPRNVIGNSQQQSVQSWIASCLAMTGRGFASCLARTLLGFVCACLAMTKCVPCKDALLFTHLLIPLFTNNKNKR